MVTNVVLTGFMGTGKTAVGRALADRLGIAFIDTDELVVEEAGMSIPEIFARCGEARFRELERGVIERLTAGPGPGAVVSTGGGAVVDAVSRRRLKEWGLVVCLTASVDAILERTASCKERPLLARGGRREVERLLRQRREAYGDSHLVIDTTELSVGEVVDLIMETIGKRKG
ncbi:MAG TPA: shikimate kinase [Deltaproteobacteria bacterium]|nr:shikimate kinase [Deltaproteobacteria bacterium]